LPEIIIQQPHVTLTGIITLNAVFQMSPILLQSETFCSLTVLPAVQSQFPKCRIRSGTKIKSLVTTTKYLGIGIFLKNLLLLFFLLF